MVRIQQGSFIQSGFRQIHAWNDTLFSWRPALQTNNVEGKSVEKSISFTKIRRGHSDHRYGHGKLLLPHLKANTSNLGMVF